jgi:hypothetical protein
VRRPLISGFVAFARGDYRRAVEVRRPARVVAQPVRSHAQRDIIDWTLTEAAIRLACETWCRR